MKDYAGCAERGLTYAQAAAELGVSRQMVYIAANKMGLTFTREPGGLKYRTLAECGMTASEAARELGVSRQSVCMAAMRHGIKFRKVSRSSAVIDQLTPEQAQDYRFLKLKGYRRDEALAAIGRAELTRAEGN